MEGVIGILLSLGLLMFLAGITGSASGGFDSLPHNGTVITLLTICGLSHRQSYKGIFMVSLAIPVTVTAITVGILSFLI